MTRGKRFDPIGQLTFPLPFLGFHHHQWWGNRINGPFTDVLCSKQSVTAGLVVTVAGAELQSVLNIREKPALLLKQGGFTPVFHTNVKPHTGDPHKFNASIDQT